MYSAMLLVHWLGEPVGLVEIRRSWLLQFSVEQGGENNAKGRQSTSMRIQILLVGLGKRKRLVNYSI